MSQPAKISASPRSSKGKSEARRLRSSGKIPAVAYGKAFPATPLAVTPKEVLTVLKGEAGKNTLIEMTVEGAKNLLVMIKDFSYHPLKRNLLHVDFVEVKLDQPVDVDVPLIVNGKAVGIAQGGVLRQVFRTLPVRSLPNKIPLKLETDVTHLNMGDHIATQDIKLPEGVSIRLAPELTLVAIVAPEKDRSAEEATAAPGAAAAPAAGAAPAAAGKDGKAAPAAAAAPAKDAKKK